MWEHSSPGRCALPSAATEFNCAQHTSTVLRLGRSKPAAQHLESAPEGCWVTAAKSSCDSVFIPVHFQIKKKNQVWSIIEKHQEANKDWRADVRFCNENWTIETREPKVEPRDGCFSLLPVAGQQDMWPHHYLLIHWFAFQSTQLKNLQRGTKHEYSSGTSNMYGIYLGNLWSFHWLHVGSVRVKTSSSTVMDLIVSV